MSILSSIRDYLSLPTNKRGASPFHRYYDNVLAVVFLMLVLIVAFVIGFIILIAFGRSDPFISPRYGTLLVWSSMLGLLALAVGVRLMEAVRSRAVRRVAVLVCNIWVIALLSANVTAALASLDDMRRHAEWRLARRDATLALLATSEAALEGDQKTGCVVS